MWSSTLTNHTFQSSTLVHIFEKIIVNEDKNIYNKISLCLKMKEIRREADLWNKPEWQSKGSGIRNQ